MKTMLGSNLQFRRLLAAMVAGLLMSTAYAPASLAQTPTVALPDFTTIVEKADPAVVNIRHHRHRAGARSGDGRRQRSL